MLTDADRHDLYEALRDELGERPATLFMTTISPVEGDEIATKADLKELRTELREELASLYHKMVLTNLGAMIGVAGLVLAAQSVN